MSALRAVEQVHALLLLRRGRVHVALVGVGLGVDNARRLAEHADADAMPETDLVEIVRTRLSSRCWDVAYEEGAGGGDQDIAEGFVSTIALWGEGLFFGFMRSPVFLGDGCDDGHGGGVEFALFDGSYSGVSRLDNNGQFASCTIPHLSSHCLRSRRLHKSRLLSVQRAQFHRMYDRDSLLPP